MKFMIKIFLEVIQTMKQISFFQSLLLAIFLFLLTPGQAQQVDTLKVYSPSMSKELKNLVILPSGYLSHPQKNYPVVYLLHGHGGNYTTWLTNVKPNLPRIASEYGMIIVCPEGERSWYWDSPLSQKSQFETYICVELSGNVEKLYRIRKDRNSRAIAGFSMGGHGALWLAFRHPDLFGACGSMSGGVDIRPFPNNWNMKDQLGTYDKNSKLWDEHTVINQLPYNTDFGTLAIIIDCGTEDFFFQVNNQLHEKMLKLKIPHDYIARPGGHTQAYWNNAVDYQLLFFRKFFQQ